MSTPDAGAIGGESLVPGTKPQAELVDRVGVPASKSDSRVGEVIVFLMVPGLLLLDLGNGVLGVGNGIAGSLFTPGDLGRGVVLTAGLATILTIRSRYLGEIERWLFVLLCLGLIGPFSALVSYGDLAGFAYDLEALCKTLYGPVLIVTFLVVFLRFRVRPWYLLSVICVWGTLAAFCLIIFQLLGIGSGTYEEFSSAHKGLFIAQNDLGLGLAISLAVTIYQLLYRPRLVCLCAFLLIEGGMFVLGTRVTIIGGVAIPLLVILAIRPKPSRARRLLPRMVLGGFLIFVVAYIAYQEVRSVEDQSYQMQKFVQLSEGDFTRVALLGSAFSYTFERGLWSSLFGDGANRYQRAVAGQLELPEDRGLAEIDWLDLWGAHGLLFVIALYSFYGLSLFRCASARFGDAPTLRWLLGFVVGLYLLHATLAGHAMWSPIPSGVVAPIAALGWLAYVLRKWHVSEQYRGRATAPRSLVPAQ